IVTERDVIKAISKGISTSETVEKIGTLGNLITVNEDDSVFIAAEKMGKYNIRHLIVLGNDGNFIGIISIRDIIREKQVLNALSQTTEEEWTGSD
ncbi:CBS domain-containing protein, partial [Acidianus sp. RZ1]